MKISDLLFMWDLAQILLDKFQRTEAAESDNLTGLISIVQCINFPVGDTGN